MEIVVEEALGIDVIGGDDDAGVGFAEEDFWRGHVAEVEHPDAGGDVSGKGGGECVEGGIGQLVERPMPGGLKARYV